MEMHFFALLTLLLAAVPAAAPTPSLSEGALLRVAGTLRYNDSVDSAKAKTSSLGPPTMSADGRTASWEFRKHAKPNVTVVTLRVTLDQAGERVQYVDVERTSQGTDPWTGKPVVKEFRTLFDTGFVKTLPSTWSTTVAVEQLRWGMGPADAAKVCPLLHGDVNLHRTADLLGTIIYNSPFADRVTTMECVGEPRGLPQSQPMRLGFLDDRLVEVMVPAPMPKTTCDVPRDCWVGVSVWVNRARVALELQYGPDFAPPLEEELFAVRRSESDKGYVQFMNYVWTRPGTTIVLRDSGETGHSYVLYRDASRNDLEPPRKFASRL